MRVYESLIIFSSETEEDQVRELSERLRKIIEEGGGTVRDIDYWGRRSLAYEIKDRQGVRYRTGTYVCMLLSSEIGPVNEVNRQLSLADSVLRSKTVRIPDHVPLAQAGKSA